MKGLVMQIGLNNGSLTKLNQGSGIGKLEGGFTKEGVENNVKTCCSSSSIFNQIPENIVQEENKQGVNSSEQENAKEKTVSIDIDSMIEGMLGDFVDSVKDAIEEAIREKIQETIQDIVKDAVTNGVNGVKGAENTDSAKEGGVNDGKNNKAVFGDPNEPSWKNSEEIREKIRKERNDKITSGYNDFQSRFLNSSKDTYETDVGGIIGIYSEEDIKGVSGSDLYELFKNFRNTYGPGNNYAKQEAALVKILKYASKEQVQEFVKSYRNENPNVVYDIFNYLPYASGNCSVSKDEVNSVISKVNSCGGFKK